MLHCYIYHELVNYKFRQDHDKFSRFYIQGVQSYKFRQDHDKFLMGLIGVFVGGK